MRGDIAIEFTEHGGRFVITEDGDLLTDQGLETSVGLCLLTDRRASLEDELPADETDRRGWAGDSLSSESSLIGSKIWLRLREKQHREVMHKIREDAQAALGWLLRDKVVSKLSVECTNPVLGRWDLLIQYHEPQQKQAKQFRYALTWNAQAEKR